MAHVQYQKGIYLNTCIIVMCHKSVLNVNNLYILVSMATLDTK